MAITIRTRTKPQYHADPAPVTVPEIEPTPVSLTAEQRQNMMTALFQAPIDDSGMTDSNAALNNLRAEISRLRDALAEANAILEDNYQRIATQQERIEDLECQVLSAKVTL